jgi:hypothetical protein
MDSKIFVICGVNYTQHEIEVAIEDQQRSLNYHKQKILNDFNEASERREKIKQAHEQLGALKAILTSRGCV